MEIYLSNKLSYRKLLRIVLLILMIPMSIASVDVIFETYIFVPKSLAWYVTGIYCFYLWVCDSRYIREYLNRDETIINSSHRYKFLALTNFLFSTKTQKEVFEPAMAEWDFEIYKAIEHQEINRLLLINLRNIYGFLIIIWMKSPIGDLIEFISKLKK